MSRIDWYKPIRTVKTQRQVFVVGHHDNAWDARVVGPSDRYGSGGIVYTGDGHPIFDNPWGEIENFDPAADMMIDWKDVPPSKNMAERQRAAAARLRQARAERKEREAAARLEATMGDNPLWGQF